MDDRARPIGSPRLAMVRRWRAQHVLQRIGSSRRSWPRQPAALIYDSPVTNTQQSFSYEELRDRVATFAGALARRGVVRGDRVILYMPMIPEAVVATLACAASARSTRSCSVGSPPTSSPPESMTPGQK